VGGGGGAFFLGVFFLGVFFFFFGGGGGAPKSVGHWKAMKLSYEWVALSPHNMAETQRNGENRMKQCNIIW